MYNMSYTYINLKEHILFIYFFNFYLFISINAGMFYA